MPKHKRTKATAIPMSVKWKVWERDNHCCILCGQPGDPVAHVINRSQGGLGIEENIVTLCQRCHEAMDNGANGKTKRAICEAYLRGHYPGWEREKCIYHKQP